MSISNNRDYVAWNHRMANVAYDVAESRTGLKWDTPGTFASRNLRRPLKKPQDSTTGILLDISTYDRGNNALLHVITFSAVSKQLRYDSIQNRIPGIPSFCFSNMKLQTWTLWYRVVLAGLRYVHMPGITLSNHIHGAIWCSMHEV